jgi:hypothetical protein
VNMAPHGSAKSSTGGTKPGEHEPVDFLATGFKVKTNCAFSVKILENFKLRSDHLASGSAPAPPRLARPSPLRILLSCRGRSPCVLRACVRAAASQTGVLCWPWASWPGPRRGQIAGMWGCCSLTAAGPPAEIKADEKGIEDFEGEMLRLRQRKEFLENRIVENKAWAANYDLNFGPFVNKYKEFMDQVFLVHHHCPAGARRAGSYSAVLLLLPRMVQYEVVLRGDIMAAQMGVLYQNAKDKHSGGLEMLKKHFDYHPEFKRWSDTFSAVPFRPK